MGISIKPVTSDFEDMEVLTKLNQEAFPQEERMEIDEMLQLVEERRLKMSAVYEEDVFIGFYTLHVRGPVAYLFFIAVDGSRRSQGYGSKILKAMTEQYDNCQIVLDMEAVDDQADNYEQRKKRKQFYLRGGFHETGYFLMFNKIRMEVLCNKGELDADGFQELLDNMKLRSTPLRIFKQERL